MLVVCLFYYRLIVRWLIEPMVKVNYPLGDKALGLSSPISPSFPPANDGDEGPVRRPKEILPV